VKLENVQNSETAVSSAEPAPSSRSFVAARLAQPLLWPLLAVAAFYGSYMNRWSGFLGLIYLFALLQMARAETWRMAFYPALAAGIAIGICRLSFFWVIFSGGAAALWIVFAFWIGLFVALARLCLRSNLRSQRYFRWLLIPFVWCGLEYFRSELYYLRFAWLSPGFAFGEAPAQVPLRQLGTYGIGFVCMGIACAAALLWPRRRWKALAVLLAGAAGLRLLGLADTSPSQPDAKLLRVAGVQMEFPTEKEVLLRLNEALRKSPETQLFVLSEYTFNEPIPPKLRSWCKEKAKYLIAGGTEPINSHQFYNTAYVVSPAGEIIFRQVKSVPIQFFKDGVPAPEQRLWNSPWGKIGICICYDLSYSRVTDRLINLGAQALIVPTMDVYDWGERQHRLHARVAPLRAAEYGIPIFRVASSGISQLIDARGQVIADAPCPGDGAIISGTLSLSRAGRLPLDRWLAPFSVGVTGLFILTAILRAWRAKAAQHV
jgi:apolipoprotein N-acyltransferase